MADETAKAAAYITMAKQLLTKKYSASEEAKHLLQSVIKHKFADQADPPYNLIIVGNFHHSLQDDLERHGM